MWTPIASNCKLQDPSMSCSARYSWQWLPGGPPDSTGVYRILPDLAAGVSGWASWPIEVHQSYWIIFIVRHPLTCSAASVFAAEVHEEQQSQDKLKKKKNHKSWSCVEQTCELMARGWGGSCAFIPTVDHLPDEGPEKWAPCQRV